MMAKIKQLIQKQQQYQ
nr:unnamed protein product [Callosobruchus analis]